MKRPLFFISFLAVSLSTAAQEAPLTLERAVQLAVERNERAAIADTTVEAAEARVGRARTAFLPRVDISGSWRNDFETDSTDRTLQTAALLTQPVFDARVFPLYRMARFERDATRFNAADARRLLAFDAAATFLTTLSLEQVLLAAENRRAFAQTNLDDVRARFEAGLVSSNDVTRAELELATAVRGVVQATGDVQSSRIDLETLVRTGVETLAQPVALLDAADEVPAATEPLVTAAQDRRPDIAAQRASLEALRAFAQEPNARWLPSVLFQAQTRNVNEASLTDRANAGFFGFSLAWPVFDAGVRGAERAERNALVRGAELQLELERRDVERELRGAVVELTSEQAALREAIAALRAARKNADETSALYREGLASALELADANRQLFEAEVAEVTARFRMAIAYLSWREASGLGPVGDQG
ncbi:MAG TPA: TolC family protein [Thermoanaerobaculia bacterium]|nr:TolC family protein [Thermoanaerobaculia bacterium]